MPEIVDSLIARLARAERSLRHRVKLRAERARLQAAVRAGTPVVVVYSPQKTGSTAAAAAIEACGDLCVAKAHTLLPEHDWDGDLARRVHPDGTILLGSHYTQAVREVILQPRVPAKFVVTLREPVATNLSWFAFAAERNWLRDRRADLDAIPGPELARLFIERFAHMSVCVWPERELGPALGYDPYATPFDHAAGWSLADVGPFEVLVLRADLDDARKGQALGRLLERDPLRVGRARESGGGAGGIYARLREAIRAHPEYIDRMLATRYARHWWSPQELERIRESWR